MVRELHKLLNQRLGLSIRIDEKNCEEKFANGYLLGEILSKFGLQPDFAFFQDLQDQETKIRNFARILPALQVLQFPLPFGQIRNIMQKKPWSATFLIYNLFKALKVLPMRDPKWTIDRAEKFQRKGSWGQFAAKLNLDYETYRALDDKYEIPGESLCRNLESQLRCFLQSNEPIDVALVPLRSKELERTKNRSEWGEDDVREELDDFDKKTEKDVSAAKLALIPPPFEKMPSTRSVAAASQWFQQLAIAKNIGKRSSNTDTPLNRSVNPAKMGGVTDEDLLPETSLVTLFATIPEELKSKKSLVFNRDSYLTEIRQKAQEYRKKKEDVARSKQNLWMDLIIAKKLSRELESALQFIRKINAKTEVDRKEARDLLYKRRAMFDELCRTVVRRQEENEARQYEYVRVMVNQGFWEMLGTEALSEEKLRTWCERAELRYFPEIYQILCQRYNFCSKIVLDHFTENFFVASQLMARDERDHSTTLIDLDQTVIQEVLQAEPDPHDPEPMFDSEELIEEVKVNGEIFRASDRPTLFYEKVELEEYNEIVSQLPLEDLGWLSAFVAPSVDEPRNLGHIVSCVINDEEWRCPAPPESKYSKKFVSLCVVGQRSSHLKKVLMRKLAMTYNLEIISVADLVREALEAALQIPPEIADPKDKGGRRKSKVVAGKKSSISKLTRGKSRAPTTSLSSLVSAGRTSPRDDFHQRVRKTFMENGSLDANTIVHLIEQAIVARVLHPKPETPQQFQQTDVFPETPKVNTKPAKKDNGHGPDAKHQGKSDSKTRMAEREFRIPEKKDENPLPFGWILTDLPVSVEVLRVIEQRLGAYSSERPHPRQKWAESKWIPDAFGPKARPSPRSFFGAILRIDFANEGELLSEAPTAVEMAVPNKDNHFPEEEEVFQSDTKKQMAKYLSSFDQLDEPFWIEVVTFYQQFLPKIVKTYSDWRDPERTFESIAKSVEAVMKFNRTVCSGGVSPEAQLQIHQILTEISRNIWNHRTTIRLQLAQRLIGTRIGKSVMQYLFKQDVRLIRDVYRKLEAQLREVASKSLDEVHKTVGLAIYKISVFPLKERINCPLEDILQWEGLATKFRLIHAGLNGERDNIQAASSQPQQQPAKYKDPSSFENLQEFESEMLRLKDFERGRLQPMESNVDDAHADKVFLQSWLEKSISPLADKVACWHRKNQLVATLHDLEAPPQEPSVLDFPFLGGQSHPEISKNWRDVEEKHAENIVRILPMLKIADCRLLLCTQQVKDLFSQCILAENLTVEQSIVEFNRTQELHPHLQPVEKVNQLYLSLCDIVDYRHAGMQCCLRKLMGRSGFTEVIFSFRNASLQLIQAEIELFRNILVFLQEVYMAAASNTNSNPEYESNSKFTTNPNSNSTNNSNSKLNVNSNSKLDSKSTTNSNANCNLNSNSNLILDEPDFPKLELPLYFLEDEPLAEATAFIKSFDLENPVQFDESMTCGTTEEEQRIFLKVTADDEEFWFNTLQSVRFFLDQSGKSFLRSIGNHKESPVGKSMDLNKKLPNEEIFMKEKPEEECSMRPLSMLLRSECTEESSKNWLDVFEEYDMEELLATVRHDVVKRQDLKRSDNFDEFQRQPTVANENFEELLSKNVVPRDHSREEAEGKKAQISFPLVKKSVNQEINQSNLQILFHLFKKTINQEINQSMLKLCRIAVKGMRKANAVRGMAAETFCILDSWLLDVHSAEQNFVDKFLDNKMEELQRLALNPKRYSQPLSTAS